ncbi:MAG: uracil-DNA glycosylase [Nitrospinales bacterium]
MPSKRQRLGQLSIQASKCIVCPRMVNQSAVLSSLNGPVNAKVFFLAEAPGRFGAGRTGIPFSGDRSSHNFEELLEHIGLKRKEVFITNAVLCNPLARGKNSRPTSAEINNCSNFLQETLDLVRPNIVVTLGSVGLDALNRLTGSKLKLNEVVAKPQYSDKFIHLPFYHPSPRVTNWQRTMDQQKKDFRKILDLLKTKKKIKL